MGITIDQGLAQKRLQEALDWALSDRPVSDEWTQTAIAVAAGPQKTYIPAYGTALLARATDPQVDALSIKEAYGANTYSLRTLGHQVLVPASRDTFSLGTTGREPLNNQPFFRYDHMDEIDRVQASARPVLALLRDRLGHLNHGTAEQALEALAAFLRDRVRVLREHVRPDLTAVAGRLSTALTASRALIDGGFDTPREAQAIVAAAFDLAHADVRSRRINDPSRDTPGDVQIFDSGLPVASAEVRAKPVTLGEAQAFIDAVADSGMTRAFLVVLHPQHVPLDRSALLLRGASRGVLVSVVEGVDELMLGALAWGDRALHDRLGAFPQRVAQRLEEIEAPESSQQLWAKQLQTPDMP